MSLLVEAVSKVVVEELLKRCIRQYQIPFVFKDELDRLGERVTLLNSILADAEDHVKNRNKYRISETYLARIRDLIYDADDILLDWQIRVDYEKVFPLRHYTPRGELFRYNAEKKLMQLIKGIDDMNSQVKLYSDWSLPYHSEVVIPKSVTKFTRISSLTNPVGLEVRVKKIIELITAEKSCQIAIVGLGGSGKTTTARKIYNDREVLVHFDITIWVTMSQTLKGEDILTSMLKQIRNTKRGTISKISKRLSTDLPEDERMRRIYRYLDNKKYLIVVDDVWEMKDSWWRDLVDHLPTGNRSKRSIIITTRDDQVASQMGATDRFKTQKLDEADSWNLFCTIAFQENDSRTEDPEYQKVGMNIVKKCDGLPLAIKTIARVLSTEVDSLTQWKRVSSNLPPEFEQTVITTLRLSYDGLPPVLKQCIMCFSLYPKDTEIDAKQLVYWWVSLGFVKANGPNSATEEGFQCLGNLVSRCLVESVKQRGYDGRIKKCKMCYMVRKLITKISEEVKFCSFDMENKQIPEADTRHLGYASGMDLSRLKNNSKLRAFMLMDSCSSSFHPALANVTSLRILDLSFYWQVRDRANDLLGWLKPQKRLSYLNIQKVADLRKFPDWIKKRQNLKILVVKDCHSLTELPPNMVYLQNLMVLDIRNCPFIKCMPLELGKLTSLQSLYGFKLTKQGRGTSSLGELRSLKKLRLLEIDFNKYSEIVNGEEDALKDLSGLKVLKIAWKINNQNDVTLINKLVPPSSLEELHLRSYCGDTTPHWLNPSSLPELLYLSVSRGQIMRVSPSFWDTDQNPWKIEGICLKDLPRFNLDGGDLRSMQYLRYVEVRCCEELNTLPLAVNKHGIWRRGKEDDR